MTQGAHIADQIEEATGLRQIFTAERGERIVSAISYRGRALIATDERILEWIPESGKICVLEVIVMQPASLPGVVYSTLRAAHRASYP